MLRTVGLVLALSVVSAAPALAQHPRTHAVSAADSATRSWSGTWDGAVSTDHGSGTMHMVISRDSTWHVTVTLSGEQPIRVGDVTEFKLDGKNATWNQDIMGQACKATAALVAGTLKGETTCSQGTVGFVLKKK